MADIEEIATNKIGGVPVWGWAAGLSAVVLAYAWWRNRSSNPSSGATMIDGNATASGLNALGVPSSGQNTSAGPQPETLDDWMSAALGAAGSGNSTDVLGALNNFLAGQPLSSAQQSLVDKVIGSIGLPPGYSSLPAAQPPVQTTDNSAYDQINQQLQDALDALAQSNSQYQQSMTQQQTAYQQSISQQMDALSSQSNTLTVPRSSSSQQTAQQKIDSAAQLAGTLGRSVKTAYGYVTPTGLVTKTDTTKEKKENAKAISSNLGRPVNTSWGWITPSGVVYKTQVEAAKAMGKK